MSEIDRQRTAAVHTLEALGYCFRAGRWHPQLRRPGQSWVEADALHNLLVQRDTLISCTDGSADQDELGAIGEAIEAYERARLAGR